MNMRRGGNAFAEGMHLEAEIQDFPGDMGFHPISRRSVFLLPEFRNRILLLPALLEVERKRECENRTQEEQKYRQTVSNNFPEHDFQ